MTKKPETFIQKKLIKRKDGLWEYFHKEGNLTKTETYKNGKLIE